MILKLEKRMWDEFHQKDRYLRKNNRDFLVPVIYFK